MANEEKNAPVVRRPENAETARQSNPKEAETSPEWYQRTRPTQGVRSAWGDRSDWSGSGTRGQNWSGGRER